MPDIVIRTRDYTHAAANFCLYTYVYAYVHTYICVHTYMNTERGQRLDVVIFMRVSAPVNTQY